MILFHRFASLFYRIVGSFVFCSKRFGGQAFRNSLREVLLWGFPLLFLIVGGYFLIHAFDGRYGSVAKQAIVEQMVVLQRDIATLDEQNHVLETRIQKLRGPNIDEDLLDERLRSVMGYIRVDEGIVRPDEAVNR